MDFNLRCNSLKCRAQLDDRAVVTTCSHVFCVECASSSGLSNTNGKDRVCPACESRLVNPDDAVVTSLNPSEDYKTSVLSGLSPSIVMECAGRAMAFYSYQATQEIVYQEYLMKSLGEKYGALSSQLDQIIYDANSEILNLRNRLAALETDQTNLRRKNESLQEAYAEKTRQYQKSQITYDKLKKRMLESDVQVAAEQAVQQGFHPYPSAPSENARTFQQMPTNRQNRFGVEQVHSRQKSGDLGAGEQRTRVHAPGLSGSPNMSPHTQAAFGNLHGSPVGSQHRTRLPVPVAQQPNTGVVSPTIAHPASFRQSMRTQSRPLFQQREANAVPSFLAGTNAHLQQPHYTGNPVMESEYRHYR